MSRARTCPLSRKAHIIWQAEGARERKRSSPQLISLTFSLYPISGRGAVPRRRPHWKYQMQTIQITNPLEARRCRYAQYRGQKARLILNGEPVTGMIRAVKEDKSSTPMRWTVKLAS